jgi:hypothetical protein
VSSIAAIYPRFPSPGNTLHFVAIDGLDRAARAGNGRGKYIAMPWVQRYLINREFARLWYGQAVSTVAA